jgi:hypothetical protein
MKVLRKEESQIAEAGVTVSKQSPALMRGLLTFNHSFTADQ